MNHRVPIIMLALVASLQLQLVQANSAFNVGFMGGLESGGNKQAGGFLSSTFGNTMDLAGGIPNMLNNAVQQVTKPLDGLVGSMLNPVGSAMSSLSSLSGGLTGQIGGGLSLGTSDGSSSSSTKGNIIGNIARATGSGAGVLNSLSLPTGLVGGLATGLAAATGLGGLTNAVTAAANPLTNPGSSLAGAVQTVDNVAGVGALSHAARTAGALSGAAQAAGALSGAAQTAGLLSGAAQTAGAVSAASQAAGAMSALGGASASMATNNVLNRAAFGGSAMNSMNSMGAMNGLSQMGAINQMNMHNMAQYGNHLQRREALSSAAGLAAAGNSIAAQSELMSGAGVGGAAEAAALGASTGLSGLGAGMEAAQLAGAAGSLGSAANYGLGQSLGQGALGLGLGMGAGAAEAASELGGAGSAALGVANNHLLGGALGASQVPYLAGAAHEAIASNNLATAAAAAATANQIVPGIVHQSGLGLNRAIAGDAIDSTVRSLGASRGLEAAALPLAAANNGAALARSSGAIAAEAALTEPVIENPLTPARQNLAAEAHNNAEAEAAIAGNDMVQHGLENSQSASLATNAYRQAKLASARDRVNIAGTIQNSARISDAAIATHDAATKAEDSLLGSELAVDSAATVLDSDAAYIPPVTNSMLRSLPYGRLGLRNILPKPLNYPSVLLPDVWLNGSPVNYRNLPFRMMPYGIGAEGLAAAQAGSSVYGINRVGGASATGVAGIAGLTGLEGAAAAAVAGTNAGLFLEGQPIISNNGIYLNNLLVDPKYAYLRNINSVNSMGSSVMPILANGQLQAQDEVNMANILTAQQQLGPGMLGTYGGFGRMNTVPMLTGSVSDANLAPTTTVGTTYPIGSALVIEPRDSYFQDYIDNASSRQNFDERQQ